MSASLGQLDDLALTLGERGLSAFCPTTLSSPPAVMRETCERLGRWIHASKKSTHHARPIGIHLEGPYLSAAACGAHSKKNIRPLNLLELDSLWEKSLGTLKILTLAPESIVPPQLKRLTQWARRRKILLSIGHSQATEAQAQLAFKNGFQGVTHAWNAIPSHHRNPGVLGAALGNPKVYLELIVDQIHVAPAWIRLTRAAHPPEKICMISDCVPAAGVSELLGKQKGPVRPWTSFGDLKIQETEGVCRLRDGTLAGGGRLLPESYRRWVEQEASSQDRDPYSVLKESLPQITLNPLRVLGLLSGRTSAPPRVLRWEVSQKGKIQLTRTDGPANVRRIRNSHEILHSRDH